MPKKVHHVALWVHGDEVEASLKFYRDGIGLELIMDVLVTGRHDDLFHAPYRRLRSIMLGDRTDIQSGIFEMVVFDQPMSDAPIADLRPLPEPPNPSRYLLHSFFVDFDEVVPRLESLGLLTDYREQRLETPIGLSRIATVRDPHGFLVELADEQVATRLLASSLQDILDAERAGR